MNMIFVLNQFKVGGVETVFINIARTIKREIYLLPLHKSYDQHLIDSLPHNVKILDTPAIVSRFPFYSIKLCFLAHKLRKNSLFFNSIVINFSDTLSTLIFAYFIKKRKTVSWIHCNPEALFASKIPRLYFYILKRCEKLCFVCETQKELFYSLASTKSFDTKKANVITNFLDIYSLDKMAQEEVHDIVMPYFLMCARIDLRTKDFMTVIHAYAQLPVEIKDQYKLVFLGDGPDKDIIQKEICLLELTENVVFLLNVANPYKYMKNATLYIHSSKSEGFGLVLLEALSCGCNIISADCKVGPREILQDGKYGELFNIGDCNDLKGKIMEALEKKVDHSIQRQRAIYMMEKGKKEMEDFINGYT